MEVIEVVENSPQPAAQNPAPATPSTPPAAPAPPALYAGRAEWRAWRREQREHVRAHYGWGSIGIWGWFWAIALILVGSYYLLADLGVMWWVKGDLVWPLLLIVLGIAVLVSRVWRRRA